MKLFFRVLPVALALLLPSVALAHGKTGSKSRGPHAAATQAKPAKKPKVKAVKKPAKPAKVKAVKKPSAPPAPAPKA